MSGPYELDAYGGWKGFTLERTGFFRVEKSRGRWWFVTPEGHPFLSPGVNHVDYRGDHSPEAVRFTTRMLRDWGFNTVGWTQESVGGRPEAVPTGHTSGWGPDEYAHCDLPYCHCFPFTNMAWYGKAATYPDVESGAFADHCDALARKVCPALADDPRLMGYFYSDTPNLPGWAHHLGLDLSSKTDAEQFRGALEKYYGVIAEAIRRYDENHLLLGDRYKGNRCIQVTEDAEPANGAPDAAIEASLATVSVLAVEYYSPWEDAAADVEDWSARYDRPILLADSGFLAPTDALKIGPGARMYARDQAERGERYRACARAAYAHPNVVGWHWCAFGRSVGRRSGLLDGDDVPYEDCVSRMRDFNKNDLYRVGASACDLEIYR